MDPTPRLAGVALGWRPELAGDLLRAPESVDFLEVVGDTCFAQPAAWREARAIAELRPVVPHGVKLSLGSAGGIDLERARRLGRLARELRAPVISEHVAFTRGGDSEIGHLTSLPFTREAVRVVARNVAAARRHLPDVPLLLENVAWTFRWPEDELSEADFHAEVVKATGCELLLDLGNLYANATNLGVDPSGVLAAYPLDRVGMVHVAGGVFEDGFYLDTHADPVPEPVFALLAQLLRRTGALPVVLERDQAFPAFRALLDELGRVRALQQGLPQRPGSKLLPESTPLGFREVRGLREDPGGPLHERQKAVALMLTSVAAPALSVARPFGLEAIARTRAILQAKRVDDALPLLARTSREGECLRALALGALRQTARAPRGAGIADALRIAEVAAREPALAAAALRDGLELRSRFARRGTGGGCAPRRGPFVGRARLPDGRSVWAWKGPGLAARVRLVESGGER